jgi:hypothetical protein
LISGGAQVRRVDPQLLASTAVPTTVVSGGTIGGMDLPFDATIAAGADAVFEYVVVLGAPVGDEDLQRWAQGLPSVPEATVEAAPGATPSTAPPPPSEPPPTEPPTAPDTLVTG